LSELSGIHESLQRIERSQGEALAEFKNFRRELDEAKANHVVHENDNRDDFIRTNVSIEAFRAAVDKRLTDQTEDRRRHLGEQDIKIDAISADVASLKTDNARAKGAGWAIIGILGALVTFIGGAVISAIEGIIHIRIG
jgi:hypothetical protein